MTGEVCLKRAFAIDIGRAHGRTWRIVGRSQRQSDRDGSRYRRLRNGSTRPRLPAGSESTNAPSTDVAGHTKPACPKTRQGAVHFACWRRARVRPRMPHEQRRSSSHSSSSPRTLHWTCRTADRLVTPPDRWWEPFEVEWANLLSALSLVRRGWPARTWVAARRIDVRLLDAPRPGRRRHSWLDRLLTAGSGEPCRTRTRRDVAWLSAMDCR